jgi:uncharacterized membrane protein
MHAQRFWPARLAATCLFLSGAAVLAQESAVFRGVYRMTMGRPAFTLCGQSLSIWLEDETPMGELGTMPVQLGAEPASTPIFLELQGVRDGAKLRVTQILRAQAGADRCAEDLSRILLHAAGTEPFWTLDITKSGATFRRADDTVPLALPASPLMEQNGLRFYGADTSAGRFALVVKPERCRDRMAAAIYSLTADIMLGDRTYRGCAYLGGAR